MDIGPYKDKDVLSKPVRTPMHSLVYVKEGCATLEIESAGFDLVPGNLLFVPRGGVVAVVDTTAAFSPWSLTFNTPEADYDEYFPYAPTQVRLTDAEREAVEQYFRLADTLVRGKAVGHRGMDHLIMSMLCVLHTIRNEGARLVEKKHSARSEAVSNQFLDYINKHEAPVREVGWYADQMHVTAEYLRAAVKQHTAQTPMQWINKATLREAKLLLLDPQQYSMAEIATALHLGDAPRLTRFFKQETGMTPSEYRHETGMTS